MDLLIILTAFVVFVMVPAWGAETAKIRRLPNRRVFFWLSVASIISAVSAGWVIYRNRAAPAPFPRLELPACLALGVIFFFNILLTAEACVRYSGPEQRGFPVLPLPDDDSANATKSESDSPQSK